MQNQGRWRPVTISTEDRDLILGALDTCAIALTTYQHEWNYGERAIYERAVEILGGKNIAFEPEAGEGEEWKG